MRLVYISVSVVCAAALLVVFYSTWVGDEFNFAPGDDASRKDNYISAGIALVGMMFGIIFGSLHRIWRERNEAMSLSVVKSSLLSPEIWRSVLVSPLVFIGVYIAAQAQPDVILSFFFSFQSGFFSDAIVQGKAKEFGGNQGG